MKGKEVKKEKKKEKSDGKKIKIKSDYQSQKDGGLNLTINIKPKK